MRPEGPRARPRIGRPSRGQSLLPEKHQHARRVTLPKADRHQRKVPTGYAIGISRRLAICIGYMDVGNSLNKS
eukprot:856766-Pyramimonas_sp.AAC.1